METLGRYQILGELGRGGCGVVYRALDPSIGRTVAIKTIRAERDTTQGIAMRERFRREARSAGGLSHPNIVTIYEFNDSGDLMFIAMECIEGKTLGEKMTGEPLAVEFVLSVLRSAADALDFAHAHSIIHRDVKPANFMFTSSGHLKMTDFGIAKVLDDSEVGLTSTGMVIGTAQYMSPEQIAAKPVTGRSDQFSLAVIAYEMLTGQKPFQGNSWASVMHSIISAEPPPVKQYRESLGDSVTTVLRKALAKDGNARYPTCSDFASELSEAVLGVTLQRTSRVPLSESIKMPLPPPTPLAAVAPVVLPETEVMQTGTGVSAAPAVKRSSLAMPVGIGIAAALALALGWFALRPKASPEAKTEPVAVATAPPVAVGASEPLAPKPVAAAPAPTAPVPSVAPAKPAPVTPAPGKPGAREFVPQPAAAPVPAPIEAPAPVVFAQPAPAPAPVPAPLPITPAPKPVVVESAPALPPAPQRNDDELARRQVTEAVNRYRQAFEAKDADELKSVWPGLGRSELASIQNFFRLARTIKLELTPLGPAEIGASAASLRVRRVLNSTDDRGAMPSQNQILKINFRRSGSAMLIESIEVAPR